ncbi:MAG TPA: serine/threonine-protein kinase [Pseudonocardiaceae bacterium]|jgi:predicted Ser/Thr protein kinase|nr:serine/threonine-protein kinase [Pseudonocardiaceae bacterium]
MGAVAELVGAMLSWLHGTFAPSACPGDWLWTTVVAGALLACLPWLGIVLSVVALRIIGNRRRAGIGAGLVFGVTGPASLVFALVLPLGGLWSISTVFRQAARGELYGLSQADYRTLGAATCAGASQRGYLGESPSVYQAIVGSGAGSVVHAQYLGLLIALPLLALGFIWLHGRLVFPGGVGWPGRLYGLPFLAVVAASAPLGANALAQAWIGFAPVCLLGALLFAVIPPLRWSPPTYPVSDFPLADTPGPLPFRGAPVEAGPADPPTRPAQPGLAPAGGRFHRIRQLGRGGFGTVWLAQDTQLNRTVALKIAHAPDVETERRMLREARALAAVHHPHCVRIYDVVEDVDGLCLVMEYIEGSSLGETVRGSGTLDDVSAARLWTTMAGALAAAHENGVLHRDVKPSNVILDPSAAPHLLDFGIARSSGDMTLTASGMLVGTPDYLAPETAKTGVSTPSSDTWQLAATVSFALTGTPPRGSKDNVLAALAAAARADQCERLPAHSAHRDLLTAALDPDPARRPTLTAVQRQLSGWLTSSGHPAEGPVTTVIDHNQIDKHAT